MEKAMIKKEDKGMKNKENTKKTTTTHFQSLGVKKNEEKKKSGRHKKERTRE